jgi:hypothetical protein
MTMTQYGTWVSYGGDARIVLAIVLLAVAGGLAFAGSRLRGAIRATRPGRATATVLIVAWALSLPVFLACVALYVQHERQAYQLHLAHAPTDPITPVTFIAAGATFVIILISSSQGGWTRLTSAAIAAAAAVMIFELPFDLIIMARIYPPIPPDPAGYRALFFAPLFLVEITTLLLLTLSPMVRLSKATFFSLAAMLAVFAVWALFGFGYPSAPVPITLNVVSKLLAFVTVLSLFLPQRPEASASEAEAGVTVTSVPG